ncbi:hypothetical protein BH11ACT4_BH11ACT4_02910 [soil metagenome]
MRVVAIGDIGVLDDMVHIGDEAMFEACVGELRLRGIHDIVGVSANPAESAARYGIRAIARRAGDATDELAETVRDSDAVVITGGGNLSSLWPQHVQARSELGRLASRFGKPLVVTGQTIGPHLDDADTALVAELLHSARLVGVRESGSLALCRRLGLTGDALRQTVDDASFLVTAPAEPGGYCLVTLANHVGPTDRDAVEGALTALLDEVAGSTGLAIVFAAHFGSLLPGPARGDSAMHERVAARMRAASRVVPTTDAAASARLARSAELVLCSRYHPAVFAVAAGVPTIGIPVDDYTTVKLSGALGNFGQHSTLPVDRLLAGDGAGLLHSVWERREEIRSAGLRQATEARQASTLWWDDVAVALAGG